MTVTISGGDKLDFVYCGSVDSQSLETGTFDIKKRGVNNPRMSELKILKIRVKVNLTFTRPISSLPNTPVARKIADIRYLLFQRRVKVKN